jgi:hypothetical protein
VRYEDFLADPAATVARILALGGEPQGPPPDFSALEIGFPLQGNRVTRSETISLKPSTDPVPRTSATTRLAQGPIMAVLSRLTPAATAEPTEKAACASS